MPTGDNPTSLKGLAVGWASAALRKRPANDCICPVCGSAFYRRGIRKTIGKYPPCCSRECKGKRQLGISTIGPPKLGSDQACLNCGKIYYRPPSQAGLFCCQKCAMRHGSVRAKISGPNHYNWKGGIRHVSPNQKERKGWRYANWRATVLQRDGWTCQKCGHKDTQLIAHHIQAWSTHRSIGLEITNGITVCKICHKQIHHQLRIECKKPPATFMTSPAILPTPS